MHILKIVLKNVWVDASGSGRVACDRWGVGGGDD